MEVGCLADVFGPICNERSSTLLRSNDLGRITRPAMRTPSPAAARAPDPIKSPVDALLNSCAVAASRLVSFWRTCSAKPTPPPMTAAMPTAVPPTIRPVVVRRLACASFLSSFPWASS